MLSIGTLIKPKLKDISDSTKGMSFDKFDYFEALVKMTPETFYTKLKGDEGVQYWKSLSENEQEELTLYKIILGDSRLLEAFLEVFNFFFLEKVIFKDGYFVLLDPSAENNNDVILRENIRGVISEDIFLQVLDAIQQVCGIAENEEVIDESKLKNRLAKKMYDKMQKAAKKAKQEKKGDINLTLPNIISAVSNRHPTIDPIKVWELTIFQLLDSFNRMQINSIFDIDCTRVSVWGDEKKTFKAHLWYKNEYDK